jgi:transcription initiation factor TFIIIB Brf1 subunit/transcription initiation factor TFIIB
LNSERCPVCGGQLIWDYERGEIVCSRCGLVVDKIYYYGPPRSRGEEETPTQEQQAPTRRIKREYRIHMSRYRMARRYVRNRPWLEVDYDTVIETGRMIRSIKSKTTLEAEKNIMELGLKDRLDEILKLIEKIYPVALARTDRSRYALAYMLYKILSSGRLPREEEVIRIFMISPTSYKRLEKTLDKILERMKLIRIIKT